MKKSPVLCAAVLASLLSAASFAQHAHAPAMSSVQKGQTELADGEVRRLDTAKGMVLLKHGEVKSINMGPMTMNFKLKPPSLATGLNVGDKVKFAVEQQGDQLIVTRIEKVK